jgi:thiol-disulfide isomerase/thioredoxin
MLHHRIKRRPFLIAYCCVLFAGFTLGSKNYGQEPQAPVESAADPVHSPEFTTFAEWLENAESFAQKTSPWQLDVDTTLSTGIDAVTTAELHLSFVWKSPSFRLAVREKETPLFLASYHNSELLRYSPSSQLFSRVATADPVQQMPLCGLAHWYLDQAGVPFLLTPDPSAVVFSDLSHVSDLGTDSTGRHFRVTYHDGHQGEWWFMSEAPRLPIAIRMDKTMTVAEGRDVRWSRYAVLRWDLAPKLTEDSMKFVLPDNAQQVEDLTASVIGQGTETLVGQPLPQLNLTDLQLQPIANDLITQPTLLYFWGTWAAPSVEQIPDILKFAEQLESRGLQIRSINVADTADRVQQFLTANQIRTSVFLDQDGNAAHALRLTQLPAVVLVGADQTVRAVFQAVTAESRPSILAAVEKALPAQK